MSEERLIGKQLDEYRLEKLLGQGGMARVYRGLDVGLKRYAAIKVIDTPFRHDADYLRRFEMEAQAIAQLDHPNIVSLYRYGQAQDVLYMAMKYVEGADLQAILTGYEESGDIMPWEEVLRIMGEIASALDYAHSKGVIHRDIKPSNIMIDEQGRAYLTDFGLALLTAQGTQGQIFGTPQYIAPEQAISSAGAVPQSDFYAIGVILYRMVTGVLPFDHDDLLEIAMLHMTEPPPSPRLYRPEIKPALETVILKSLAKEPRDRYPDGASLITALDATKQQAVLPLTVPALSIMERVTLDMERLPPPVVDSTAPTVLPQELPLPPTTAVPTTTDLSQKTSSLSPKLLGIGAVVLLLLLLAGGYALLGGGGDVNGEMKTAVPLLTNLDNDNTPTAVTGIIDNNTPTAITGVVDNNTPTAVTGVVDNSTPTAITGVVDNNTPTAVSTTITAPAIKIPNLIFLPVIISDGDVETE